MCFFNIKACQHILLHQIHKIKVFKKVSYDPFNKKKQTDGEIELCQCSKTILYINTVFNNSISKSVYFEYSLVMLLMEYKHDMKSLVDICVPS